MLSNVMHRFMAQAFQNPPLFSSTEKNSWATLGSSNRAISALYVINFKRRALIPTLLNLFIGSE